MNPEAQRHWNRYYGKYAGVVVDNADNRQLGRVQVTVPTIFADAPVWARPCFPFGHFQVPPVGAKVWVEFEAGDTQFPIWVGIWYADGEVPAEAAITPPDDRVIQTPSGHTIELMDKDGEEKIVIKHKKNSYFSVTKDGSIVIANDKGSYLNLNSDKESATLMEQHQNVLTMNSDGVLLVNKNGVVLEMKGDNVRILAAGNVQISGKNVIVQGQSVGIGEGAAEPTLLGMTFLTAYATHTHGTALGPSTPPIPPVVPAPGSPFLTTVTKVK
ncbi:MAG: phage baseplate assembly protein V [Bryobacteraceae bacterium]